MHCFCLFFVVSIRSRFPIICEVQNMPVILFSQNVSEKLKLASFVFQGVVATFFFATYFELSHFSTSPPYIFYWLQNGGCSTLSIETFWFLCLSRIKLKAEKKALSSMLSFSLVLCSFVKFSCIFSPPQKQTVQLYYWRSKKLVGHPLVKRTCKNTRSFDVSIGEVFFLLESWSVTWRQTTKYTANQC